MRIATTKLQLGTAAVAMAAAAAITPVVAQADSIAPLAPSLTSFAQNLGSTVGTGNVSPGAKSKKALGSIFQNNAIWLGSQNPNYQTNPNTVQVWTFTPLNAVLWAKPFIPGLWTWFESKSQQTCLFGITTTLGGPYSAAGTYTRSYNHGGCNPS